MNITDATAILSYPARPTNGGPPTLRRDRLGQWIDQPKFNGWRTLVHVHHGKTATWNRHGQPLSIAKHFSEPLSIIADRFPHGSWLDCEALERRGPIRNTLVVFDLLPTGDRLLGDDPTLRERLDALYLDREELILPWWSSPKTGHLHIAGEIAGDKQRGIPDPRDAIQHFQAVNEIQKAVIFEGIVTKKADSIYPIQTRSASQKCPFWIKHRFA